LSRGLRMDMGDMQRREDGRGGCGQQDSPEQQKPSDAIGFASMTVTHDSENPFVGVRPDNLGTSRPR
jgi:hypothetical protein